MFRQMKQCPFLLRLCQEVLLRVFKWFFFFRCLFCRKRKVNAECVSLPHEWNRRPHTAGNQGRMIVVARLDKSCRIGKQSYFLCCGLPFSRSGDVFLIFVFYADSRAEGVEFQTILSASRLSDIFFMRLSVASVVFVSGAWKGRD